MLFLSEKRASFLRPSFHVIPYFFQMDRGKFVGLENHRVHVCDITVPPEPIISAQALSAFELVSLILLHLFEKLLLVFQHLSTLHLSATSCDRVLHAGVEKSSRGS